MFIHIYKKVVVVTNENWSYEIENKNKIENKRNFIFFKELRFVAKPQYFGYSFLYCVLAVSDRFENLRQFISVISTQAGVILRLVKTCEHYIGYPDG